MDASSSTSTHKADLEQCLSCAYFHAAGCAGNIHYCLHYNAFLMHDAACGGICHNYEENRG